MTVPDSLGVCAGRRSRRQGLSHLSFAGQPVTAVLSALVKGRGHTKVMAGGSGTAWPSPRPRPLSSAAEAGQFRAGAGVGVEEMGEFVAAA